MHPVVNDILVRFETITLQTHGVEVTLVQHCLNVMTLRLHWIKVFQLLCLQGIYLNANTSLLRNTGYSLSKGFLCIPFRNPEAVTENSFLKKTVLNFVNISINNLQFHPFLLKVPILCPLETPQNLFSFFDFYRGYKKRSNVLKCAIKISLFVSNVAIL